MALYHQDDEQWSHAQLWDFEQMNVPVSRGGRFLLHRIRAIDIFRAEGPSISIDTACSSSLVAVHTGLPGTAETKKLTVPLQAGVNAILSPHTTLTLCKAMMLVTDGQQCHTFSDKSRWVRTQGKAAALLS